MSDGAPSIPIGPIIGAAVGLGILAATVKITKDALDTAKEKQPLRPHPTTIREPYLLTPKIESKKEGQGFDIDARINRMLGR